MTYLGRGRPEVQLAGDVFLANGSLFKATWQVTSLHVSDGEEQKARDGRKDKPVFL
jgi:hypothetical protein